MPWRVSSSGEHNSYYNDANDDSDNGGCFSKWSSSRSDEYSYYSGGSHSNGSLENDSSCDSHTYSDGDCDSAYYNSASAEQSVRGYMNYDPCSNGEDSNNREDPGEGEPPSESIEEEATSPSPRLRCPLTSGSIIALWGPQTSVRW